jgi:hypothetical protein
MHTRKQIKVISILACFSVRDRKRRGEQNWLAVKQFKSPSRSIAVLEIFQSRIDRGIAV